MFWFDANTISTCAMVMPTSLDDTRHLIWQKRFYERHDVMHHHGLCATGMAAEL